MAKVREAAEAAGRDPGSLRFSTSTVLPTDDEAVFRRLGRLREAGLDEVVLKVQSDETDEICAGITDFAERLLAKVSGNG